MVAECRLLKVGRSTLYYKAASVSADDLVLRRWRYEQFLKTPFYGSRRMVAVMRREGFVVNRKRVKRLMRVMGLEAIYQKPNTSLGHGPTPSPAQRRRPLFGSRRRRILHHGENAPADTGLNIVITQIL